MKLNQFYIDDIIKNALKEDINYIDAATDLLIDDASRSHAVFLAKSDGILCGMQVALRVFELLGDFEFTVRKNDGDRLEKGEIFAEINGPTAALLKGERTALNLLQHMSGIATATARYVALCEGTKTSIADTRKTLPGLRALQKYAVVTGGGRNHRFNLSDCAMLKDNHIDAAGGITAAVNKVREKAGHTIKIEVETRNMEEIAEAVACKADIIMFDNMTPAQIKEAAAFVNGRALTEASGGITDEILREYALAGVDIISVGALTHSVKAFDISLKIRN